MLAVSSLAHLVSSSVFFFWHRPDLDEMKTPRSNIEIGGRKREHVNGVRPEKKIPIIYPVHRPPYHLRVAHLEVLASSIHVCSRRFISPPPSVTMYAPSTFVNSCAFCWQRINARLKHTCPKDFFLILHPVHRPPYHLPLDQFRMLASSIHKVP